MKKIIIVLSFILAVVLSTACTGKGGEAAKDGSKEKEKASEESEDVVIGKEEKHGMEINAVYVPKKIHVEPVNHGGKSGDIHIEADIHATDDNDFGFSKGDWIPYLTINYSIRDAKTNEVVDEGQLHQMVAGDPHYASNVKIPKNGEYELTYKISAPDMARHAKDVDAFYEPFTLKWNFEYEEKKK